MAAHVEQIELGFVEEAPKWKLVSKYFPDKVGGKPAWLHLGDLPCPSDLQCQVCNQPMVHLLQIYAPVEHIENCFHRTIFVFLCKNPDCCQVNCAGNFAVFRSQLARDNSFYSREPPEELEDDHGGPSASDHHSLCSLCGCLGPKRCARCQTTYCSKHHQTIEWELGHKKKCKGESSGGSLNENQHSSYTLPEYEIIREAEDYDELAEKKKSQERTDEERMKDYEEYAKKLESQEMPLPTLNHSVQDEKDLEDMAARKADKCFKKFQERIKHDCDQILRYQIGGTPLWISSENIPLVDSIPPCPCGANRQFEFQILPQLLNYLKLDAVEKSIDWGTLLIYTCSKNCDYNNKGYHKEFILKQDFSDIQKP